MGPVLQAEEELARAVVRSLCPDVGKRTQREALLQVITQPDGQITHLVDRSAAFLPEPLQDLRSPVGGFTQTFQHGRQVHGGLVEKGGVHAPL